jgi:anti-anti-sigma regulatory factor
VTEAESGTAADVGAAAQEIIRLSVANLQGAAPVRSTSVLFCDVVVRTPIAEIRLSGDLTEDTVADLGSELAALIRTGHEHLLVDGRGLSCVSPACVGVLNRAAAVLGPIGGELIVTGLGSTDAHRLRSAGLHSAIQLGVDADRCLASPGEASLTRHHPTGGDTP